MATYLRLKNQVNTALVWKFSPSLFPFPPQLVFFMVFFSTQSSTKSKWKTKVYKRFCHVLWECEPLMSSRRVLFLNLNAFCVVTFGVSPSVEALPGGRSVITFFASPRPCFCFDFLNFPQWRHVSLRRQSSRFNAVPNPLEEWGHAAYLRNTNTRIPLKKAIPSKKIMLIFLKTFVLNVRHQIFRMNPFTVFFFWCATFRVI